MTSVADKLGFGPKREAKKLPDGNWEISILRKGKPPSKVTLTPDQYERYQKWERDEGMIQDLLPDLSANEREMIKTGITQAEWDEMFKEDE